MIMRYFLVVLVIFLSVPSFAQGNEGTDVVDLKIETNNLYEFSEFKWETLKEVIAMDNDEEFVVSLVYHNESTTPSGIENFTLNYKFTEANFPSTVANIKSHLETLMSLAKEYQ